MNSKERLLLFILAAVNFTHIMDFMIMMPLGPQLMNLLHINPQQFGLAVSAYAITAGISSFISAFFVDRFDRKKVLLFAYIGFVIGTFSCALAPNYEFLVAARVLAGLFGGMIGAQVLAIVADTFEYERRAREKLMTQRQEFTEDLVFRALGVLTHARRIASDEAMSKLSEVRLGLALGLMGGLDLGSINRLLLLVQPAHLQHGVGRPLEPGERKSARAALLRQALA